MRQRPDFPTSRPDFDRLFPDEPACFKYLLDSRWPREKFCCPGCGHGSAYIRPQKLQAQCTKCLKVTTATAGTVMHGSSQPLRYWLMAAWMLATDKRGVSATFLARELGLRIETAWNMLHKLRAAMVDPDRTPLRGKVEADETLIGGERKGGGSGTWKGAQQIVLVAVEVRGKQTPGRIRLKHVPQNTRREIEAFVSADIEKGSHVVTDARNVYAALEALGMTHEVESTARGGYQEDVLPTLHMAVSNLKKTLTGTYKGAVRMEHLQAYLNEFAFRFNRRGNLHAAFQTLLGIAPRVFGPTYKGLYSGEYRHANPAKRLVGG